MLTTYSAFKGDGTVVINTLLHARAHTHTHTQLFNFTIEYAIRRVQRNLEGMKLNGSPIHQLLVYVDNVNILGGSVHIIKKNMEALVFASKETGQHVNADKTKYMVMSREMNTGIIHNIKTDNSSFEMGGIFQIFGNNLKE